VLQHPGVLKNPEKLRESWDKVYKGANNAHKIAVLEEGVQYKEISIPQKDSQFLETRQFQLNEICRLFRVPPHLVGDLSKATFSNIEHQSIDYVVHTIRPWLTRIEKAVNMQLLSEKDRLEYFTEFNADGLLRGDYDSRMMGYARGIIHGIMTPNEVRSLENLNPMDGGDTLLINSNVVKLNDVLDIGETPKYPTKTGGEQE
jgi:HK97 family phage portal protein